jgi:hypothetical protein
MYASSGIRTPDYTCSRGRRYFVPLTHVHPVRSTFVLICSEIVAWYGIFYTAQFAEMYLGRNISQLVYFRFCARLLSIVGIYIYIYILHFWSHIQALTMPIIVVLKSKLCILLLYTKIEMFLHSTGNPKMGSENKQPCVFMHT